MSGATSCLGDVSGATSCFSAVSSAASGDFHVYYCNGLRLVLELFLSCTVFATARHG